ncbi:hypothetical protein QVD17_25215 [Tagetes erecta]|uniref:Erythronate-4-phosphate dehydrogenase family protein n=1 Tax=Tagetes erecta TaxID=13708 RepID=A0AAD8KIS2_TARER|nr:hypothetical protein QVD17_25215 [Tagetes erecta]
MVHGYTPEYLTLNHIPLDPDTVLEVNGKRCTMQSCRLRRNRVDKKFEEVTFVSTDSIRLSGSVRFEVFDGEDIILSGTLDNDFEKWSMSCESKICGRNGFAKGKETVVCDSVPPMIEVYVAGSFSGTPIILTKTLPLFKTTQSYKDVAHQHDLQMAGYSGYDYESSLYLSRSEYMEGEDGELTWFNAGVRVGVGIGLGVFLGVGVGAGLLVRTYQSATRNFRRRFW